MTAIDEPTHILVVDDSPTNLRILSQILSERGYHVRAVTSGARALASVELTPPDLVLLDIRMPDMDGYAVCEQLKATPKTADIPVLFISALDDVQDKMKAFAAGGVDYITKPFQLEEVMARVQTHLALRQLQRNLQAAHDRMAQELALAAQVQASFMHKTLPEIPGWQLAVALVPTRLTSGDFYDTVVLPDGSFGLLIADVMDKGVGAALYMAMSSALLRAYALEHPHHPELVCQAVNARLLEYTTADQFLTVFLGMLDPASKLLKRTGAPLGMLEDAAWRLQQVQLQPGDCLVLYTDGVTEAASANDESFGLERLRCVVQEQAGQPATGVREAILAAVQQFTAGVQLTDDIALIVLVRDTSSSWPTTRSGRRVSRRKRRAWRLSLATAWSPSTTSAVRRFPAWPPNRSSTCCRWCGRSKRSTRSTRAWKRWATRRAANSAFPGVVTSPRARVPSAAITSTFLLSITPTSRAI